MDHDKLQNSFTYHAPNVGQAEKYLHLREKALELALLINDECPDSREKSSAITKLEECVMWANKSIACNEQ